MKLYAYAIINGLFFVSLCHSGSKSETMPRPHNKNSSSHAALCCINKRIKELRVENIESIKRSLTGEEDNYEKISKKMAVILKEREKLMPASHELHYFPSKSVH